MNQLTGNEKFTIKGADAGVSVLDFWRWANSDMLNNTYRGVLAEFLVYSALYPCNPQHQVRVDWMPFDITSPRGVRIEVKSAAYLQSWEQEYYAKILFDISPHRAWSPDAGYSQVAKRNSDLYVFCLYTSLDREHPITDLDFWEFYIIPTASLDEKLPTQKTISLSTLMKLEPVKTKYDRLLTSIENLPM